MPHKVIGYMSTTDLHSGYMSDWSKVYWSKHTLLRDKEAECVIVEEGDIVEVSILLAPPSPCVSEYAE